MKSNIYPFVDTEPIPEFRDAWLLMEVARESARRQQPEDADEKLGLDRLATFIDTIRLAKGVTWKEFALSSPRPFNPVYLMLMSLRLISRKEITDEVFYALEERLLVPESTLRQMFSVEEIVQQKGLLRSLRVPRIRISAPFDTFVHQAPLAATLGERQDDSRDSESGESTFEDAGVNVRYRQSAEEGFIVTVEAIPGSDRRVPTDLSVSVVSTADGSVKAGPLGFERGRSECGHINMEPWDRLVIESGNRG